jgi:hypothetical protein
MRISKFGGLLAIGLVAAGLAPQTAKADMIGSTFGWQYYGGGSAYNPDTGGSETSGVFTDNGGAGGSFIEPGPLEVFDIEADGDTITFDYSPDTTIGPWSSSPLSLAPTIYNGVAITLLSPGSWDSVTIDPATNMAGFGTSNFSFTDNQIEIDWQDLPFSNSTIVTLDVGFESATPEPGTLSLMLLLSLAISFCAARRRFRRLA